MNRRPIRSYSPAILLLSVGLLFPIAIAAQTEPVDLTAAFRSAGVEIVDLQVQQISGIVLMRGTTDDREKAANAGTVARNLGYQRVANLIALAAVTTDVEIIRFAEGKLGRSRSLDGCKFHIGSLNGIVRIGGSVDREAQKDMALQLLRKIDGVKEVHSTLIVL